MSSTCQWHWYARREGEDARRVCKVGTTTCDGNKTPSPNGMTKALVRLPRSSRESNISCYDQPELLILSVWI
ncbi:hypothetical protein C8F04DRAFT_1264882 [Mycena alexandri]|uniref:Uncharacterized protein n=1 Tax=Mycena alexandri TaxID=1745969 RepID=A0AAD6SKI2_9AGAR|nr:hypothetical protein C8F04DRAFT_1264882 [Mycena alexandri]